MFHDCEEERLRTTMAEQIDDNIDLYAILGVNKNATDSDVKKVTKHVVF